MITTVYEDRNYFKTCLMRRKDSVCTSQETRHFSATEPNRLMLFGETVAVCCENRTEHTDTVRTSQETRYFSVTEPNRLMLFGETVAVCCENHMEHNIYIYKIIKSVPHRKHVSAIESNRLIRSRSS
jgi:hypothetical protein